MKHSPAPKSVKALSLISLLLCLGFLTISILSFIWFSESLYTMGYRGSAFEFLVESISFDIMFVINTLVFIWTMIFSIVLLAKKNTSIAPVVLMALVYPIAKIFEHVFSWALRSDFYWNIFGLNFNIFNSFDNMFLMFSRSGPLILYDLAGILLYLAFIALFLASAISAVSGGYNRKIAMAQTQLSAVNSQLSAIQPSPAPSFGPPAAVFPASRTEQPFTPAPPAPQPPAPQPPAPPVQQPVYTPPVQSTYAPPATPQPVASAPAFTPPSVLAVQESASSDQSDESCIPPPADLSNDSGSDVQ